MNKEKTSEHETAPLSSEQRFQVLMAQLNERYQAWHHMRERSMTFTLWILGLAIAVSWKLLSAPCSSMLQRIALSVFTLALGAAAFHFLKSLARGVHNNRCALINVETALEVHQQGRHLPDKAILPKEYTTTKPRASAHFFTLYILLAITGAYLMASIWLPLTPKKVQPNNSPQVSKTTQPSTSK